MSIASNYDANWIDWTDWAGGARHSENVKTRTIGTRSRPGSIVPLHHLELRLQMHGGPANGSASVSTIPSSGSYSGYICPGVDSGNKDATKIGIYYNGCYNSVPHHYHDDQDGLLGLELQLRLSQQLLLYRQR